MDTLGKSQKNTSPNLVPKAGQRKRLLPSSKVGIRCPALGFYPNSDLITDEMLVDYLASILANIFLAQQTYEHKQQQTGSHILPRFDKGAS